nr:uncharacterized protein LOC127347711 [Lolium perenne]
METAEQHWDLLNENILEPLGYPEQRRNLFPRDDLLQLAGDDCKDLISASRKICHNLNIKRSRTCDVRKLIGKMDVLPELVIDLQASSARGAVRGGSKHRTRRRGAVGPEDRREAGHGTGMRERGS